MIPKDWEFRLRKTFTNWDRSTAYGCNLRDISYDHRLQEFLKKEWDSLQETFNGWCKNNQ